MKILKITIAFFMICSAVHAQDTTGWNNKKCAVVLTYDDGIDDDLDNIIPALDSLKFKATFYLIGSSPVVYKRLNEWRLAAQHGHELGNHSLFHPCDGSLPGRKPGDPENDLSKYTVGRAVNEIRVNNTLLKAIDGKTIRTFAYPCGDTKIGNVNFYDKLKNDFLCARGTTSGLQIATQINLDYIYSYSIHGRSADYMIDLVKKAIQSRTLLVFLFHGVGGHYGLNEGLKEHSQLLHYLKAHEKDIWITTMVDVDEKIKTIQKTNIPPRNK